MANAAENVKEKQSSVQQALQSVGLAQVSEFLDAVTQLESALKNDEGIVDVNLSDLLTKVGAITSQVAKERGTDLEKKFLQSISNKLTAPGSLVLPLPVKEVQGLVASVTSLANDWSHPTADEMPNLIARIGAAVEEANGIVAQLPPALSDSAGALVKAVVPLVGPPAENIAAETWTALSDSLAHAGVLTPLRLVAATVSAWRRLEQELISVASLLKVPVTAANLNVPALDVPWESAPDTRIVLPRTTRMIGDDVHLTAVLKVHGAEYARSDASFLVQQFGWHKLLSPAIILARPLRTTSSFDHDFKFAPAVSWLFTYYPRSTQRGLLSGLARFGQLGVGLHAAFLNQDVNESDETGLGLSAGLWNSLLVGGLGWNLTSDARAYGYVGSNLIPALHLLGYGKEAQVGTAR